MSFVNLEEDHVGEKPAYGVTGYTSDGKYVILDHKYDLWLVSLDGSATPRNLTRGTGSGERDPVPVRAPSSLLRIQQSRQAVVGAADAVEPRRPSTCRSLCRSSAFGDADKKDGFFELRGDSLVKLVYEDRGFGRAIKAKNADRLLITRETFAEFPDYWVTDTKFSNPKRLTNANPQQSEYLWGHRILFDYKDKDGHKLQGTLAIPDNYQPGQKLPMLVDYYEKYSQNLNRYAVPRYATAPQFVDYVSNGYLVMQPDIYYHTGRSHTDMLNSIEAAVKRVIELGYADPKRVGLHGHSYSGQGSAYISTHVEDVRGDRAPAPRRRISSPTSTSSGRRAAPTSTSTTPTDRAASAPIRTTTSSCSWTSPRSSTRRRWTRRCSSFRARTMVQSIGCRASSSTTRSGSLHKPVIFLSYEGEAHGFTRYDNQYDVMVRMHQFYDHYLKGEPAADWITKGIPFLKKKTPTGAAAQPVQLMGGGAGIGTPGTAGGAAGSGGRGGGQ